MKLQDKLAVARARLVAADISPTEAALDVDVYARTILGWDRARLLTEQAGAVPAELEPRFSDWLSRREQREPTAYIVGVREFWGLDFTVTPAVLIPRPETEFIVEEAVTIVRSGGLKASGYRDGASLRIADVGTGSGCVAVSLAYELPGSCVTATDLSGDALSIARGNAVKHRVADRVEFVHTSYLDEVDGPFDLITANPPYVKERDKPALSRDVRHEPDVALFGGADGLRDIGGVLDAATSKLKPGGWFVMEFGYGQEDDVRDLVAQRRAFRLDRIRHDFQDIPRTVVIQRQG